MEEQHQQTFATTDFVSSVRYIQIIHPTQGPMGIYCKEEVPENEYCYEETNEESLDEALEETYIEQEDDPIDNTVEILQTEILESVVVERKKPPKATTSSDSFHVTKRLVQVKGKTWFQVWIDQFRWHSLFKDSGKPKGRKRVIADQTRAIRKIRANTNKPYVNAKGQEVKPKEFDELFMCTCPKHCTDPKKLPLKTRRQVRFNSLYEAFDMSSISF